jgi:hypothetical protein
MASKEDVDEKIRDLYNTTRKEYEAFDRTLSALASIKFLCTAVTQIANETISIDFRAKLQPASTAAAPYTPDAVITQTNEHTRLIELKTSWSKSDIEQIEKYAKSEGRLTDKGGVEHFGKHHCILLGYQNTPGDKDLDNLFSRYRKTETPIPLVVFRYSLEIGPEGNRLFFVRVPDPRNGLCPQNSLGKAFNSTRGFSVSAENFRFVRAGFHKANDRVIESYAGIFWWTIYANGYLTDEQRAQMAERGRLETPLILPRESLDKNIPVPPNVEVPFTAKDIKLGLEFLRQARLVTLKRKKGHYEVVLKTDKRIRLPKTAPSLGGMEQDVATKIITLYATYKILKPIKEPTHRQGLSRKRRDRGSGYLPFPE